MDQLMIEPHKRSTSVTVEYKPKRTVYLTEWSSNGIPIKDNKLEVTVTPGGEDKVNLECKDQLTNVKYESEQFNPNYEKYMVLVVDDEKATLQPCAYFKMKPKLDLPLRTSGLVSSLSYKEQMDEINEKFGSKKTIRRIEERRKNAIAYGAEDYKDMKEKAQELTQNKSTTESSDKKGENAGYEDPFLLPPRNESALQVDKVYNVHDIIPLSLVESLKASNDFTDIKSSIKSPMVEHLALKAKSETDKAACLFLDALIQFKSLKPSEINRADVLGIDSVKCADLVHTIIKNYSISTIRMGKPKRTMDEKCKDKVIIHSIILCVILNNYRPLLVSALAQAFQTSVLKIKKFGNIVGCHVDMNTSKTDRLLALRIPLYSMENEIKYKRRKTK